jgi:hypothetical protein
MEYQAKPFLFLGETHLTLNIVSPLPVKSISQETLPAEGK